MNFSLFAETFVFLVIIVSIVGFLARREYRKDSVRIAKHLGLKIGFFGGIKGTYRDVDVTIEPGKPIKILLQYPPAHIAPDFMDINLWLLRKGFEMPDDALLNEDGTTRETLEHLENLDPIFDRNFDLWCSPAEFGQQTFSREQKLGSRLAKSALQHIEVNWLFPGLCCLTNLSIREVDATKLQHNLDLIVDLGAHITSEADTYLNRSSTKIPTA